MKIHRLSGTNQSGNILMVMIVTTGIIGFLLATYLTLVRSQNTSTMRSRAWNATMPLVEAGIEDAMTHINKNGATNIGTYGWTVNSNGGYGLTRNLGEGFYTVVIERGADGTFTNGPNITSEGFVPAPLVLSSAAQPFFAQIGTDVQPTAENGQPLSRRVQVTTRREPLWGRGMVAKGQLDMSGNNVRTDSFDSADPIYSNNGVYDPNRAKDNGDVASNSGLVNSLDLGNANIHGRVSTGPGGSVSVGSSGAVGSSAWQAAGGTGIQPGYSTDDMNVDFPDVREPFSGGYFTPSGGTVTNDVITYFNVTNNSSTYPTVTNGSIYTNASATTSSSYPSSGTYLGTARTNVGSFTSSSYPSSAISPVFTNTAPTSSRTYPAAGTYLGDVIAREVTTGKSSERGTYYDYARISGYTYNAVSGYSYLRILSYDHVVSNATTNTVVETYNYILGNGNYQISSLTGKTLVTGNAVLHVTGNVSLSGQDKIVIRDNASLRLYVSGATATIGGNGVVNEDGNAANFSYFGLPSNTSLSLSGNAGFTGAIYAPNADFSLGGGGNNSTDFVGASVTKSVKMNGHFNFHYDENLAKVGPERGYVLTSWNEVDRTRATNR